jgi:FAD/FMN-containing dehydrogenase
MWGLAVDTITSLNVVLANGTDVTASATENRDLFWVLRGAGPGFAVVTTFKFKTLPAPAVNVNWAYTYTFSSVATAASAFKDAQNWGQMNAPKELGYGILLFPEGTFIVRGTYYGSKSSFDTIIAPLLAKLKAAHGGKEPTKSVKVLGWIDSLTDLAGSPLVTPVNGYDQHDTFVRHQAPKSRPLADGNSMPNQLTPSNQHRSPCRR